MLHDPIALVCELYAAPNVSILEAIFSCASRPADRSSWLRSSTSWAPLPAAMSLSVPSPLRVNPSPAELRKLETLPGFSIAMTSSLMGPRVAPTFVIAIDVWLAYLAVLPMLLLTCLAAAANPSAAAPVQCAWMRATSFSNSAWMSVRCADRPDQPLATSVTRSGLALPSMAFISSMFLPPAKFVVCFSLKHMFISV
ncbi:hypothetical protein AQJ46_06275 [Streptomyces canus]|uniref:Uncharacterized protein n=1 Tax=Streptomyces canus TaxID=58343 RepID=A0A101SGJ1_9ACTN|nr:hypothetical protein AQJ46_06275 [Streptomyces canus]